MVSVLLFMFFSAVIFTSIYFILDERTRNWIPATELPVSFIFILSIAVFYLFTFSCFTDLWNHTAKSTMLLICIGQSLLGLTSAVLSRHFLKNNLVRKMFLSVNIIVASFFLAIPFLSVFL
jgi:hypothetical protein